MPGPRITTTRWPARAVGRRRRLANAAHSVVGRARLAVAGAAARLAGSTAASGAHTTRGSIINDPLLGWAKPPGSEAWLRRAEYDVHLVVNAHGLRGPDRAYAKPEGTRRILLLGDSFSEGYTVPEEATLRAVLESSLAALGCGRWEVINGGTQGYSTDQEYFSSKRGPAQSNGRRGGPLLLQRPRRQRHRGRSRTSRSRAAG